MNAVPRRRNEEDRSEGGEAVCRHRRRGRGLREGGNIAGVLPGLLGSTHGPRPPQPQAGAVAIVVRGCAVVFIGGGGGRRRLCFLVRV